MQRHQRGRAGTVDGEGRPCEVKGEGDPVGGDAHGRPSSAVVVNGVGVVVYDGLVVPIHQPCNNIVYIHTELIIIWITLHPPHSWYMFMVHRVTVVAVTYIDAGSASADGLHGGSRVF